MCALTKLVLAFERHIEDLRFVLAISVFVVNGFTLQYMNRLPGELACTR